MRHGMSSLYLFAVSETDGHPNKLAHSINAEALYNYLIAHQLLPVGNVEKVGKAAAPR